VTASPRVQIDAVTHDVYAGSVAEAICEAAAEQRADLIVMSTHGHGGSSRSIYGSVADQVIAQSPIPIVLVPTMSDRPWPAQSSFRMLVSLDGSRFAEDVLGPAGELALALHADLFLIGAVDPSSPQNAGASPFAESAVNAELHDLRDYLGGAADRLRKSGLTVRTDAEVGRAATVIGGAAQRRYVDLIALATHGRSGVARQALGSVASATLRRVATPVFLVRPDALRQPVRSSSASAQRSAS
jgi:nucleotide-binding universal stress UspA family protein